MAIPKSSLKKRGKVFYRRFSENGRRKRISLHTDLFDTAKERQRQFDSARARGEENVFPTKTPLASALAAYAAHMKASRTRHGYAADLSYLRNAFGPICEVLKPRRQRNNMPTDDADLRCRENAIAAVYLEHVTVAQVSDFIRAQVERYGLQAKTANRYREVLRRLFSWSMEEGGVRMPADLNPAAKVKRYKERAPEIRFLTLRQIDQQLDVLQGYPVFCVMVATYICAGLRREEAIWLTVDDVDFAAGFSSAPDPSLLSTPSLDSISSNSCIANLLKRTRRVPLPQLRSQFRCMGKLRIPKNTHSALPTSPIYKESL